MPRVIAKSDNIDELNARFDQQPLTQPVFLNSVPKSGTHLLRNIVRMFSPVEQHYHAAFIQIPILRQHLSAFDKAFPKLSWGHLLFSDESAIALRDVRHVLLVRDPYDWVLARARFFLSDSFQGGIEHIKNGRASIDAVLNMMIFGVHQRVPSLNDIYTHNGVSWLGAGAEVIRYEDLVSHVKYIESEEAEAYFARLLRACGRPDLPDDWRQRVALGADRNQSGTARENLANTDEAVPDTLSDTHKALVEYAAPGLRSVLGYT